MKKLYENRGAVAVFLILILVPMITCTSIFVEAARVKLAQSVVSSAGDLALNTVMTNFDQGLNDYFGMLASCQDMEQLLSAAEDYFITCVKSQDIDTTYLKSTITKSKNLIKNSSSDVSDVLGINVDEGTFSVEPTKNGSLTNPALIKTEIVDFMKYRGPINGASELFELFKKIKEKTDSKREESDMLDKGNDFYDYETKLLKKAYAAYEQIKEYNDLGIDSKYFSNLVDNVNKYEADYKKVHYKYVYDICGIESIPDFIDKRSSIKEKYTENQFSQSNLATAGKIKNFVSNARIALKDFLAARKNIDNIFSRYENNNDTHSTRYYINVISGFATNGDAYNTYVSKLNSLTKNICQLKNAYENCKEGAFDEIYTPPGNYSEVMSGAHKLSEYYEELTSKRDYYYNEAKSGSSAFVKASKALSGIKQHLAGLPASLETNGSYDSSPANSTIKSIYAEINKYYDELKEAKKQVDDANKKLDSVKKMISTYVEKFNAFKTAAYNSKLDNNESAASVREDIRKSEDILKNLTEESVKALIDRLNNIQSCIGSYISELESFKYNGKKLLKIENINDFGSASDVKAEDISTQKSEIKQKADSTFSFTRENKQQNVTNNNNPDIEVNIPDCYKWMKRRFADNGCSIEDPHKQYDGYKNSGNDSASTKDEGNSAASKNEISGTENLPSGSSSSDKTEKSSAISKVNEFIQNLFSDFGSAVAEAGTDVRDNLYTVDYIMSMFSYDTYEYEGKFSLLSKDEKEDIDASNAKSKYSTKNEEWKSKDKTKTYNKSLTNHLINDKTCYSYLNEVEYILCGGNNSANKSSIYAKIYLLRFAMNLTPVFSKYFMDDGVCAIADGIQGATCGVIPAVAVKFAICLGLAAMEAAKDLSCIKVGLGIKLVKNKDELFMAFSADSFGGKDGNNGDASIDKIGSLISGDGVFLRYSDYLKLFLFIDLIGSKANTIYKRVADVVQVNMDHLAVDKEKKFLMSKAQIYYTINADITVTPLMLSLPLISSSLSGPATNDSYESFKATKWNSFKYKTSRGY